MKHIVHTLALILLMAPTVWGQVSITTLGPGGYSENFDGLINTGSATMFSGAGVVTGAISGMSSGWIGFRTASGAARTLDAGTGSVTTGSIYSFGIAGTNAVTDRALGSLGSNAQGNQGYAVQLTNNTGSTIRHIVIMYDGEQWRDGGNATPVTQSLLFDYTAFGSAVANDAVGVNGWTNVPAVTFTSPIATVSAGPLDGNAPANRTANIKTIITGLAIANGSTFWIRWRDNNDANNDHALAIDNLVVNVYATATWYATDVAGADNLNTLTNWSLDTDGTSEATDAEPALPALTTDHFAFQVNRQTGGDGSFTLATSVALATNSSLTVGDGTLAATLSVPDPAELTGTVNVSNNGTIQLGRLSGAAGSFPTFNTLAAGSTVAYNGAGAQGVLGVTYANLTIAGSGTKTPIAAPTVNGYLLLTAGSLDNSTNNVTLPTGSIVRRSGGTITATPNYTGERSVQYAASVTAGPELPATVDSLQIVVASTTLTLGGSVNATDRLGFTGNANRINLAGNTLTVGDASTVGSIVLPVTSPANGAWVHSGTFTRFVNTSTAALEFPIGTPSFDRRVTITFASGNPAGTTVSVSHFDFQSTGGHPGIENTTFPLSVGGGLDIDGSDQVASFYWTISSVATDDYDIALRGYGMVAVADPDQLRILSRTNASGAYSSPGFFDAVRSSAASLGNVTIVHSGLFGFSQFALATTEADVLPVTWLAVAAERVSAGAEVSWSTASELNNERFEVQRSTTEDFGRFVTVGQVAGRGTTQGQSSYRVLDREYGNPELTQGPVYYRIRQVDFDGRSSLSRVVRLDAAAEWAVYPNPVTGPLQLVGVGLSRTDAPVQVQLMGADGRLLVDLTAAPATVAARVDAAMNQTGAGLYVLRVGGKTIRLVKP